MQPYRWFSSRRDVLASAAAQRHPQVDAFARLVHGGSEPLVGSLTVVVDNEVLHFGCGTADNAEALSLVHRDVDPRTTDPGPPTPSTPQDPEGAGFDLQAPDLGLEVDRNRRFPRPVDRDVRPGQWVHPVVKVHTPDFFLRALSERNLGLGESFLDDEFEMLRGSICHMVAFLQVNRLDRQVDLGLRQKARLLMLYLGWRLRHSHNEDIADHYDMGDNVMVPMLGATGCYSCGYMEQESDSLDQMQLNKMNLVFSKMRLRPGMRVLDTGCGNGGMAVHAATAWGCEVEGFTNSHNMASLARRNAERNGVSDKVTIHHGDFSILASYPDASFDAIYEVGVWEHLRFSEYQAIMRQCWRILKPGGRMLIHSMGSHTKVHQRDAYIQKYIFRDSNQIRLHGLLDEARQLDMYVADVENIGRHYYWTLWYWRENLLAAYERDPSIDEHTLRLQLYFLECGMSESRYGDGIVYQILLHRDPRTYLNTWRVDGRVHDIERGGIVNAAMKMLPSHENAHMHNDADAEHKFDSHVYAKPSLRRRVSSLLDIVRSTTHM